MGFQHIPTLLIMKITVFVPWGRRLESFLMEWKWKVDHTPELCPLAAFQTVSAVSDNSTGFSELLHQQPVILYTYVSLILVP